MVKDWRCLILSGLAGAVVPLAFSPFGYWPVILVSLGLLFYLLAGMSAKIAAWRSLFFGIGLYGTGVSWVYVSIHQFGGTPVALALLFTILFIITLAVLFFAPLGWLFGRLGARHNLWHNVLLFAGLWVVAEWFRSWFLTGFPWLLAGYSLLDTPVAGLAPVIGVYGLSLLLVLTASVATALLQEWNKPLIAIALATACLGGVAVANKDHRWTTRAEHKPIRFAAVQGNISQNLKWAPAHLDNTIKKYLSLSHDRWQNDLLFWPENAIPTVYQNIPELVDRLEHHARETETALVMGMPWYANGSYYNALIGLGAAQGMYFKQKLVPFGEYVPLGRWIRGIVAFFNLPMSSFRPGEKGQQGLTINQIPVASYICYEVVYPDFAVRHAVDKGFLLTVSNDTWFGRSIGPEQHFQMVRMRALETGRYQLRVTNDGMTALIGPTGKVISAIPRYREGVLEGEIPVMTGTTPFMRFGSWPVLLLSVLLVLGGSLSLGKN